MLGQKGQDGARTTCSSNRRKRKITHARQLINGLRFALVYAYVCNLPASIDMSSKDTSNDPLDPLDACMCLPARLTCAADRLRHLDMPVDG